MGSRGIVRRLVLVAAAVAGVVAGHAATYLLAFRDDAARGAAFTAAGHSHWPEVVVGASALGIVAVGVETARRLRRRGAPPELGGPLEVALRLAALQTLLFVALEVGERLAAGWTPGGLLSHSFVSMLALGILVQVAVAAIVAVVLRAVPEVADIVRRSLGTRVRAGAEPASFRRAAPEIIGSVASLAGAWGPRGPPRR
jgi:hypothetical protein